METPLQIDPDLTAVVKYLQQKLAEAQAEAAQNYGAVAALAAQQNNDPEEDADGN